MIRNPTTHTISGSMTEFWRACRNFLCGATFQRLHYHNQAPFITAALAAIVLPPIAFHAKRTRRGGPPAAPLPPAAPGTAGILMRPAGRCPAR